MIEFVKKDMEPTEIKGGQLNVLLMAAKNTAIREDRRMTAYFLEMAMLDLVEGGYIHDEE